MKAADIEWSMLRGALIGLAIALAVAGGMLGVSYRLSESAENSLQRAHTGLRIARDKYRTVDEEEAMIEDYYPRFQALVLRLEVDEGNRRRLHGGRLRRSAQGSAAAAPPWGRCLTAAEP